MGRVGPCNGYRQSWRIDQLERRLTRLALARWNNRWFLGLLAAGFVVLLALLEVTFLRFPSSRDSSGTGPKANVAIWFGSDGAGLFYLGLGLVYAGLYLWVASQSARSANSRRAGAACALAAAAVWLVVSVITNLLPALVLLRPLALLVVLGAPLIAGMLSAKVGGLARDAALAGFWCGLVIAVLIAAIGVGVDNVFATTLVHTSWSNDPTCPQPAGPALAGCEIGDDLGLVAVELTFLPIVWAGLGAIAGAVGTAASVPAFPRKTPDRAEISTSSADPDRPSSVRAPIIFSGIMLVLFLAEMILKLV